MEKSYWESRWKKNKIGFHTPQGEEALHKWWHHLITSEKDLNVLIPLCGKSPDIEWIAKQGANVIGVEFIELACEDFFKERKIHPFVQKHPFGNHYVYDRIELWASDLMKIPEAVLSISNLVYDRAALVALPPHLRVAYIEKIAKVLKPGSKMLLISFDYPQKEMNGPPFSIPEQEINVLFSKHYTIRLLEANEILSSLKKYEQKGLSHLKKLVFLLERK